MEHCSNAFQSGASPKHEWTGWSTKIKLRSYWEDEVHVVFKQTDKHIPVCEVRPVSGSKKSRVLHRNLLFPCTYWPVDESNLKEPHRIREIVRYIRKQVPPPEAQQVTNPESTGEPKYREEEVPDDLHNCAHGLHYVLYSRPFSGYFPFYALFACWRWA